MEEVQIVKAIIIALVTLVVIWVVLMVTGWVLLAVSEFILWHTVMWIGQFDRVDIVFTGIICAALTPVILFLWLVFTLNSLMKP